ncbi:MAG: hypothetical protein U0V49_10345 [Saprospiraceae bacterium]
MNQYLILLAYIVIGTSCQESDTSSPVPELGFIKMSRSSMDQGDLNQDSVLLSFSFKDGDGDLGQGSSSPVRDISVIDVRTGLISDQFKLPDIPDAKGKPITGDFTIRLFTTCCIFPLMIPPCTAPPQFPYDTIQYEVFIKDRAGHESNHVRTPELVLNCK